LVILDQIDDIFHDMGDPILDLGRKNLFRFLDRIARPDGKKPRVFLVIVGRKDEQDWWRDHFWNPRPHLDGPTFYRESRAEFET